MRKSVVERQWCHTIGQYVTWGRIKALKILNLASLVDVGRKQNPCMISFTQLNSDWTRASRIDRFSVAKSSFNKVSSCQILSCLLSDHHFIILELSLEGIVKCGAGVWRFKNSLLSNADFKTALTRVIADFKLKIPDFVSLRDWWDSLKIEIRKATVNFSVRAESK